MYAIRNASTYAVFERLYETAWANGYNVLALGQRLDDFAESFLMSTFHNGRLRSTEAHYANKERDLRVIRPFVYVREKRGQSLQSYGQFDEDSEEKPNPFW